MTDLYSIDVKVNSTISKIDSFVKNPTSPPPLDRELAELLTELNAASIGIEDTQQQIIHQQRIDRLKKKIEEYNRARKGITSATRGSLAAVSGATTESKDDVDVSLRVLKTTLEHENNTPMTVESLGNILKKLNTEKSPDARAIILNTAWSRLSAQGYNMTIQCGTIALENRDNTKTAAEFQGILNTHLNDKKFTLNEIQSTIMTGTGKFGDYVKEITGNEKNSSLDGYIQHLTQSLGIRFGDSPSDNIKLVRNNTKATQAEKAFLISYLLDGYTAYDIAPDVQRRKKLQGQDIELRSSTTYSKIQSVVANASGGVYYEEQTRMQQNGKSGELTFETFMDNPALAIAEYPWTSLALIAGSIYQFGFMKTIGGLFAGAVGIKALNELASKTEWGSKLKKNLGIGLNSAVDAAGQALGKAGDMAGEAYNSGTAALASGTAAADIISKPEETMKTKIETLPARTPSQEKGYQAMKLAESQINMSIEGAKKRNSKLTGTFDQYEVFIRSEEFQSQKLSSLIFNKESKDSVFLPTSTFGDLTVAIPTYLDNNTFKLVLRAYMGIGLDASGNPNTPNWGEAEKKEFLSKAKIDDSSKDKTFSELITKLYS